MSETRCFLTFFLLSLSRLASAFPTPSEAPYDCSAIQAGNSQYNLSALGGNYEVKGINDGTARTWYLVNICEDIKYAGCTGPWHASMLGNMWSRYTDGGGWGQFSGSEIDSFFGRSDPSLTRPTAKQLPPEGGGADGGGENGLVVEFYSQGNFTPKIITTVHFICDHDLSGLEDLKKPGCNSSWDNWDNWVEGNEEGEMNRNDAQYQTPSLQFLNWTEDSEVRHLHLEWKTRLACGDHTTEIAENKGTQHQHGTQQKQQSLVDFLMRPWEQFRLGL